MIDSNRRRTRYYNSLTMIEFQTNQDFFPIIRRIIPSQWYWLVVDECRWCNSLIYPKQTKGFWNQSAHLSTHHQIHLENKGFSSLSLSLLQGFEGSQRILFESSPQQREMKCHQIWGGKLPPVFWEKRLPIIRGLFVPSFWDYILFFAKKKPLPGKHRKVP